MKLDRDKGRYTLVRNKWLRIQFATNKVKEGYSLQAEVGPLYRGPGIWIDTGRNWVVTLWVWKSWSVELVSYCGDCTHCNALGYTSKRKLQWYFSKGVVSHGG